MPSVLALSGALVLQQGFMFTRTWLRVGLLAAEQDASDRAHEDSRLSDWGPGAEPVEDTPVELPPNRSRGAGAGWGDPVSVTGPRQAASAAAAADRRKLLRGKPYTANPRVPRM